MKAPLPNYRHIRRYRQIAGILLKYGFSEVLSRFNAEPVFRIRSRKKADQAIIRKTAAERFRLVLEDLGPAFIKFGQMLSLREDLLPSAFISELCKLQTGAAELPFSVLRPVVEKELGCSIEEVFEFFSEKPEASASIAQVHEARFPGGCRAAVKIRRPGIDKIVETDMEILHNLAVLSARYFPQISSLRPAELVSEFSRHLKNEMDFLQEGRNMERFRTAFKNDKTVYIPEFFRRHSTKSMLVMEFIEGNRINSIAASDRKKTARHGAAFFLRQIFDSGFFHADPHPGNLFVRPGGVIVPVDFGMIGYCDSEMKNFLADMIISFVRRDPDRMLRTMYRNKMLSGEGSPELRRDLRDLMNYYYNVSTAELETRRMLGDLMLIIRKHHVMLPSDLAMMIKAVITVEALASFLDPDFLIIDYLRPYMRKLLTSRFSLKNNIFGLQDSLRDFWSLAKTMPQEAQIILDRFKSGNISIQFNHHGLEKIIIGFDAAITRLAFSIIIAAIVIGSSLIMHRGMGALFMGMPLLGLIRYSMAGIFSLWLLFIIIRSGKY